MKTMVFEFGLSKPLTNITRLDEQFIEAHRYYNDLISHERDVRVAREVVLRRYAPYATAADTVAELEQRLADIRKAIKAAKQAAQENTPTPELDAEAKTIKAALKKAYREKSRTLREARTDQASALKAFAEADYGVQKDIYNDSRTFWGTKLVVSQSVDLARRAIDTPSFRRWDGRSQVAVQIQATHPLSVKKLFEYQDARVGIRPVPEGTYLPKGVEGRRKALRQNQRTRMYICVGAADQSKRLAKSNPPVTVEFDVFMHRPLPEDGQVKWVRVLRENIGNLPRYKLQITVETNQVTAAPEAHGTVGVDIGWASMADGSIRVGYFAAGEPTRGTVPDVHEAIVLDRDLVRALQKPDELRSIRDRNMDQMKRGLAEWLAAHEVPEWLSKQTSHLSQWRSAERFYSLARRWKGSRFDGDEVGFAMLDGWAWGTAEKPGGDLHLYQWEVNQRDKALRRRREVYRVVAAKLADKYEVLKLEDFDLRGVSRKAAPETEGRDAARSVKKLAAPSELRRCLEQAFMSRGRRVFKIDPKGTSKTCHLCGESTKLIIGQREQECGYCGASWDRDLNGATNILWRDGGTEVPDGSKAKKNRWAGLKAKKAALVAANEAMGSVKTAV